jgi:outer membrane protein
MLRTSISKPLTLLPLVLAMGLAGTAQAQSLMDLYRAAQGYDSAYQAAQAQLAATSAKVDQAQALYAPTVNLQAGLKRSWAQSNSTSDTTTTQAGSFYSSSSSTTSTDTAQTDGSLAANLSQPLVNRVIDVTISQAQRGVAIAEAAVRASQQDLMVRVSAAYFDVLAASDTLAFVRAQKAAVAEQLASAKRNFEVGTATITDTREAQARFDLVTAQEIAAENDLTVKKSLLNQQVGVSDAQPRGVTLPLVLPRLEGNEAQWVAAAEQNQPQLQSKRAEIEVAQLESEKSRASVAPSVALSAALAKSLPYGGSSTDTNTNTRSASSGSYGTWSGTNTHPGDGQNATIGVTITVPLFTGRTMDAKLKETLALEEKARKDLETLRRNAAQTTRTAFYGVQSGMGQVKAFEAAEVSSQSALDANKLGYQVGVRINIDVLNSQSQLFDTKAKLAKARYDVLVGGLRLRQAAGTLAETHLQEVNDLLAK